MTTEQIKANVEVTPKTVLALVGGRLYKREGRQWWRLSNAPMQDGQ